MLKIPRMWLVMWLILERNPIRRTSAGVLIRCIIIDRLMAISGNLFDVPELSDVSENVFE
jgi:hypothetical protein